MFYIYDPSSIDNFSHVLVPEIANREGLFQLEKAAMLTDEVTTWLDENIGTNNWILFHTAGFIGFISEEDAMAFKLRW